MSTVPPMGSKVLTAEPMMADVEGRSVPVFARAMCEVLYHNPDGTVTLMVMEGDTMSYVSAAGGLIANVYPEQIISREAAIAAGD